MPSSSVRRGRQPSAVMRPTSSCFCGVPSGLLVSHSIGAGVAHDALGELGQLADGLVVSGADVDHAVGQLGGGDPLEQEHDRRGEVVDVQQLAPRAARAPQARPAPSAARGPSVGVGQSELGFVELADHGRQHVARAQVEVVAGAEQVGRHQREVVGAVLAVEAAAELDAGDLGDRVGAVGLLERSGQQVLLFERLRRLARVDAGAAQKDELLDAGRGTPRPTTLSSMARLTATNS